MLDARHRAILNVVRDGAESATPVCQATGYSLSTVVYLAQELVRAGLLCALDGEPWAASLEGIRALEAVR